MFSITSWVSPGPGIRLPSVSLYQLGIASLVAQMVKSLPAMRETWLPSLGWEDPLEKEIATHSSILAWKIPWMEEPGRLQFMGLRLHLLCFTLFLYPACRVLVPQPGIKPGPPAAKLPSPNHWIAREFPSFCL